TGALDLFLVESDSEAPAGVSDCTVRELPTGEMVVAQVRLPPNEPAEIWVGRTNAEKHPRDLRRVSHHNGDLKGIAFGPEETFTWSASDGLALDGVLIRPPGAIAGTALA